MKKYDYNFKSKAKGKLKEHNSSFDSKTVNWEAEKGEVRSDPLIDSGMGEQVVLRRFDFQLPPGVIDVNETELLKHHKGKILAFLWKDELEPVRDFKLVMSKNKQAFRIFATCKARKGSRILERPQLLQEITNATKGNS